jgi:hypothetical protein
VALARAVEAAIVRGELDQRARCWGKVVLLEQMAGVMGVAPTRFRNQYYRRDARLERRLLDYTMSGVQSAVDTLRALEFRRFSPIVWKRPIPELIASRRALPGTLELLRTAERYLRLEYDPPTLLRREVGTVATEVMACALTFLDGLARKEMLEEGDRIFRVAMGPVTLESEVSPEDAALFARFWENRGTRPGLEWSNVWDDPSTGPTIELNVVELACQELEQATLWTERQGTRSAAADEGERVRQFAADKAKWLAKAGRFKEARRQIDRLGDFPGLAAQADVLLVKSLELQASNALGAALRIASQLAELLEESSDSIAPVTSAMMVHNIELMRGRRPRLGDNIAQFLREIPVVASEHLNLPRYRQRLLALDYPEVAVA